MFCCDAMKNLVSQAGQRGSAVLVEKASIGLMFLLQSRGVAYEDEAKLRPAPIDVSINIASTTGMQFCPSCGRRLLDLIRASPAEFEELARKHRMYLKGHTF